MIAAFPIERGVCLARCLGCGIVLGCHVGNREPLRLAVYAKERLVSGICEREKTIRPFLNWGSQEFAEKLLQLAQPALNRARDRGYKASLEKKAHDTAQAEDLLREGLRVAKLDAVEAQALPGSDARKVEIAQIIWQATTVSQSWLAERLWMKSAANVSQLLRRRAAAGRPANLPSSFREWLRSVKK